MIASPPLPEASSAPHWMQKLHYAVNPLDYMESAARRAGDLFSAPVIGQHALTLFVCHPQALQHLLGADQSRQFAAPPNQLLQPIVGDRSIFVLEGQRHRRERKLLMPPFHGERMQGYGALIRTLAQKSIADQPLHTPFSARERMQDVSLEVILRVVFGLSDGERFRHLKAVLVRLTNALQSPLTASVLFFPSLQRDWGTWTPWGRFRALQRQVSELLYAEIRERRQAIAQEQPGNTPGTDILSLLIATRDEAGEPMSDAELHDELMTLLLAGHETTATAIAWALYWIHVHPPVRDQLLAELDGLQEDDAMAIARLPYLTAICHETLRIYPVAMLTVPREVKEPVELMGHQLAPGTRLYGCIYLTHQRPDLYPDPKQFRPERFLERQFTPYEFLPFGGGIRRCIGEALALFEMKLVVATLMSSYALALAENRPEQPQRRGVTLAPGNGVRLMVQGKR